MNRSASWKNRRYPLRPSSTPTPSDTELTEVRHILPPFPSSSSHQSRFSPFANKRCQPRTARRPDAGRRPERQTKPSRQQNSRGKSSSSGYPIRWVTEVRVLPFSRMDDLAGELGNGAVMPSVNVVAAGHSLPPVIVSFCHIAHNPPPPPPYSVLPLVAQDGSWTSQHNIQRKTSCELSPMIPHLPFISYPRSSPSKHAQEPWRPISLPTRSRGSALGRIRPRCAVTYVRVRMKPSWILEGNPSLVWPCGFQDAPVPFPAPFEILRALSIPTYHPNVFLFTRGKHR